jgi:hypothetical protein
VAEVGDHAMQVRTAIGKDRLRNLDIYRMMLMRLILRKSAACAQTDREECRFIVIRVVNGRAAGMYKDCCIKWVTNSFTRRTVSHASYF